MTNIFYFRKICGIGGTEQYLYEIAKKYHMYDITIYYDTADEIQLKRLKTLVRCKKRKKGELVKCKKAFFNFNIDMIDDVEAEEYIFVSHAIFQELGYKPPIDHPKLTRWIGVSQYSADKIEEFAKKLGLNIKAEVFYNPLQLEPKEKVIRLVTASRLQDKTKGGDRIFKFIEALDRYCERTGRHYIFEIFSDSQADIRSKNVVKMKPRVDVRPYIADCDYLVQLSNDMETYCYSINEALGYGVKIITTPLTVLNELNIPEEARLTCDWDMSNVDEVVRRIFEDELKEFTYIPPKARYEDILDLSKSNYEGERNMKVKATAEYAKRNLKDAGLNRIPKEGEEFEVSGERYEILKGNNKYNAVFVEAVGIIREPVKVEETETLDDPIVEVAAKKPKTEKAVKKTTKKAK